MELKSIMGDAGGTNVEGTTNATYVLYVSPDYT
jgi:hypothetical protein